MKPISLRRIVWSIIIFVLVFGILGIPYTLWWFNGDDFSGIAIAYHTKTFKELLHWFIDGNISRYLYPTNNPLYVPPGQPVHYLLPCFGAYYRPLYCIYLTLLYWMFGVNAYPFYLANVFFHALNTVVLFNVFANIITCLPAVIAALFFAFHPQIGYRFGAIVNLHYYIDTFLMLVLLICFFRFLQTRRWGLYAIALLLFMATLFTRETSILLPCVLALIAFAFLYQYQHQSAKQAVVFAFVQSSLFIVTSFLYLALRLTLYPVMFTSTGSVSIIEKMILWLHHLPYRIPELLWCSYDVLFLSWLPWGYPLLRGFILAGALLGLLILFLYCTQKLWFFIFVFSGIIMLWPSWFINYSPRYLYEALPFFMLAFVIAVGFTTLGKDLLYRATLVASCGFLFFLLWLATYNLLCRQTKLNHMKNAVYEMLSDKRIAGHALCFAGFPGDGFSTGIEQAFWVMGNNSSYPIVYDGTTIIIQHHANVVKNNGFFLRCCPYFDHNYIHVTFDGKRLRLTSSNESKVIFYEHPQEAHDWLGTHTIRQKNRQSSITDIEIEFAPSIKAYNPIIITWDYEKQRFMVVEPCATMP